MPSDQIGATPLAVETSPTDQPLISLVIACRDVARYIDDALFSARNQSLREIEILVVDDGSTDDTKGRVHQHATLDSRIRVFDGPGRGPAAARNIGLQAARGTWIGVLDGDDIMHPRRLELILADPKAATSDIIAENQILFFEDGSSPRLLLEGPDWQRTRQIDLPLYIRANTMFGKGPALGYLKPLIRRQRLLDHEIGYDETLRIGEDYDLIARLMRQGASFTYLAAAYYFYRRHSASISFRLGAADIAALIAAADRFAAALPAILPVERAAAARRQGLQRASDFAALVSQLKARQIGAAAGNLAVHPGLLSLLAAAATEGISRRLRRPPAKASVREATQADTKSCGLLWHAAPQGVASFLTQLRQTGWQPQIIPLSAPITPLEKLQRIDNLLALSAAPRFDLILTDEAALIDYIPYLLSPAALVAVVATDDLQSMTTATWPALRYVTSALDDATIAQRQRDLGLPSGKAEAAMILTDDPTRQQLRSTNTSRR